MVTRVEAGSYSVRGVSVGGLYTSLHVPQLNALFDVGMALRSTAAVNTIFLSHAHADHVGALVALLGMRGMLHKEPPRVFMPEAIAGTLLDALSAMSKLQRYDLSIEPQLMKPGDCAPLRTDLHVRAFPTFHPVPSLGYQIVRRVNKLLPALRDLPGEEIARRRKAGEPVTAIHEHLELAYATDTLVNVLDETPSLLTSKVLILECSFLDERKRLRDSRAGCHIHLSELLEYADRFENEHLVLMHFSQIYKPNDVRAILEERCPPSLWQKIRPFAPKSNVWPG